jgi:hypothetical protein
VVRPDCLMSRLSLKSFKLTPQAQANLFRFLFIEEVNTQVLGHPMADVLGALTDVMIQVTRVFDASVFTGVVGPLQTASVRQRDRRSATAPWVVTTHVSPY